MTIYKDDCFPFEDKSEDILIFNDNLTIIDKMRFRISNIMYKSELKFDEAELEHLKRI